ncbi:hypothetical protein TNCT_633071 [Trichonephila clavata]|uniref:Uncharacterized protein n=1 Tax=Trichonephila clavata TaxID=2740835 RepID=A0A8X6HP80_TRICU|nr:hypothetical protein TNCT_633071 [Trichonephila clavata]
MDASKEVSGKCVSEVYESEDSEQERTLLKGKGRKKYDYRWKMKKTCHPNIPLSNDERGHTKIELGITEE